MSEWIISAEDIDYITGGGFTVGQKLVRCKDCKEWTQTAGDEEFSVGRCEFLEHDLVMNKGFCAWGVRKDDAHE